MPANTWPLESPMLPPLVLRPPHGPRLVRLLVLILAVIFYLPPAGWGPITNGPEGELAGAALDLLHRGGCSGGTCGAAHLHGPLILWFTRSSFAFLGVSEFAARLPAALAAVAVLWLTLRLAERFGTLWTGFTAAMLLLCSPGMLTLGRVLTPAPLAAALTTACVYCLQRSVRDRPERRRWLLMAWIAWGFTTLAGGWLAGAVPVGMVLLLALFYPEARLRFRGLLSWEGVAAVALTGAAMTAAGFPPGIGGPGAELTLPRWQLLASQGVFLFPWSLLLLPAVGGLVVQACRRQPLDWNEALPLAWLAAAAAAAAADPTLFSPLACWPAFAVWAALRLQTMHRNAFLDMTIVITAAACGGLVLTQRLAALLPVLLPAQAPVFAQIPAFFWPAVTPVAFIAMLAFTLFTAVALWAEFSRNRRVALLALFAAMIPAGFAFADIGARFAPYFSGAGMAACLDAPPASTAAVFVEPGRYATSSLLFYLSTESRRRLRYGAPEAEIASAWQPGARLLIAEPRLPFWEKALGGRCTVECKAGGHLLLAY
ncbi:MAG: glycosyltransferase family 39 protein [Chthoniobacteraceae bacterium]|nr:glycosyltransferase family 39 protein [Chthoniobacteraceae bacterium]